MSSRLVPMEHWSDRRAQLGIRDAVEVAKSQTSTSHIDIDIVSRQLPFSMHTGQHLGRSISLAPLRQYRVPTCTKAIAA